MSILRHLLILFGFLLICFNNASKANEISTTKATQTIIDEAFARLQQVANEIKKDEEELTNDRKKLEEEKIIERVFDKTDVFRLNVGGDTIDTTRQTLSSVSKYLFTILFNGRWEQKLQRDENGIIFLDFNPVLFRHLLDQLQLSDLKSISLPSDPSLVLSFRKMITKLQLQHLLSAPSSQKNILTLDVDGQIITTQRSNFEQTSVSLINKIVDSSNHSKRSDKSDIFIDYHPKIVRHFIKLRRENKPFQIQCQNNLFSIKEHIFFGSFSNNGNTHCNKQISDMTMSDNSLKNVLNNLATQKKQLTEDINQLRSMTNKHQNHLTKLDTNDQNQMLQIDQFGKKTQLLDDRLKKFKKQMFYIFPSWNPNGVTIAGGNGQGQGLNQLDEPFGVYVDNDQTIYIPDSDNHRIVEWKKGATQGRIVAGGNGDGNRTDQLSDPRNFIIDRRNNTLIIADQGNKRVVRWPRQNGQHGETIISNMTCIGLAMNRNGDLYVSDYKKDEVRRWKIGETQGTLVAGGNGRGSGLNQFYGCRHIFVDENESIYASDNGNDRVMKWVKGAKEGIVVAGGNGRGNSLTQLSAPNGIFVGRLETVYVVDSNNNRIVRWVKGSKEGEVVVGGNGRGNQTNQFNYPIDISFDGENNLYVSNLAGHSIQKFLLFDN